MRDRLPPPPEELFSQLADRIADASAENMIGLYDFVGLDRNEEVEYLTRLTRLAVLRAFGCTCLISDEVTGFSMYFENITCPVHGIGPVADIDPEGKRPEPGA